MRSSYSFRFTFRFSQIVFGLSVFLLSLPIALAQGDTRTEVAAIVNGQAITSAAVDATITAHLHPLQQQIYAMRKVALENLITRSLLETEAKKRGVSLNVVKRQMAAGDVQVTNEQVEALYFENASAFASMSPDEAKERLRLDLESQARMRNYRAAVAALRRDADIAVLLEEPRLSTVRANEQSSRGPKTAPVVITEFSDFQCPYCREAQTAIKQVLSDYKEQVRWEFKHLPLDIHAEAFAAAKASICAGEQASFWNMHDALFKSNELSAETLKLTAGKLGLNVDRFVECISAERTQNSVRQDLIEARRLGINSTPTFLINGKLLRGAVNLETFKTSIERELQLSRARSLAEPAISSPEKD